MTDIRKEIMAEICEKYRISREPTFSIQVTPQIINNGVFIPDMVLKYHVYGEVYQMNNAGTDMESIKVDYMSSGHDDSFFQL